MVRAGTLDRINEALDDSHFREGGFTNLVIEP